MTVSRSAGGAGDKLRVRARLLRGAAHQALMVLLINIPAVSFGLALGWVSLVSGEGGDVPAQAQVVAAAGGTFLAGLLGVPLSARALAYGRKTALFLTSLGFVACWSLKLVGGGWWVAAARLAAGLGGAAAWCISPLMAKEMCSAEVRGAAVSALVLAHNLGLLLMYVCADVRVKHTSVLWWCLALSLTHCAVMLFVPESPSYLAAKGRHKEARASLAWLRGVSAEDETLDEELASLPSLEDPLESSFSLIKDLLSDVARRKAFVISLIAVVLQEACGVLALLQFAERVFVLARSRDGEEEPPTSGGEVATPARYALWLGVMQFVASAVALYLVERVGRKPLLVTTACLVAVFMGVGAGFVWCGSGVASGVVPGVMLAAAVAADSAGLQPVPYAMLTEMFHYQYRSCVHLLVMTVTCVGNTVEVFLFPAVVAVSGGGTGGVAAALALSASITMLYAVFAVLCVPETRGRTVEEIYLQLCPQKPVDGTLKCHVGIVENGKDTNSEMCSKETIFTSM